MTETKHTSGPWGAEINDQEARIHSENFHHTIGWVPPDYVTEDGRETLSAEGRANAKLFAAAPDLLDALRGLLGRVDPANSKREITLKSLVAAMDAARAAIAKAEGRS